MIKTLRLLALHSYALVTQTKNADERSVCKIEFSGVFCFWNLPPLLYVTEWAVNCYYIICWTVFPICEVLYLLASTAVDIHITTLNCCRNDYKCDSIIIWQKISLTPCPLVFSWGMMGALRSLHSTWRSFLPLSTSFIMSVQSGRLRGLLRSASSLLALAGVIMVSVLNEKEHLNDFYIYNCTGMILFVLSKHNKMTDTEFAFFTESLKSVKIIFTNKKYFVVSLIWSTWYRSCTNNSINPAQKSRYSQNNKHFLDCSFWHLWTWNETFVFIQTMLAPFCPSPWAIGLVENQWTI